MQILDVDHVEIFDLISASISKSVIFCHSDNVDFDVLFFIIIIFSLAFIHCSDFVSYVLNANLLIHEGKLALICISKPFCPSFHNFCYKKKYSYCETVLENPTLSRPI